MCFNSQAGRYVFTSNRWYTLEEKEHGVNQLRVVGGVCDCCLRAAMQFYDGSQISSLSSSSSSELESQQGTAARAAVKESIGDLTSTEIATNDDADILNNHTISNSSSINNDNNNISHGNNAKITSLGIPMHPVPEIEIAELTKIIENAHRYLQIAFAE